MMHGKVVCAILVLLSGLSHALVDFEVPKAPVDGISDPYDILSVNSHRAVVDRIENFQGKVLVKDASYEVQIAIAIVEKMNLSADSKDEIEEAAEKVARSYHNSWGVGLNTEYGGTGILIYLSVYDRILYISRGGALDKILSDKRIDKIISKIRPEMKQAKYAEGLVIAIDTIDEFLRNGEATWSEIILDFISFENFFTIIWMGIIIHSFRGPFRQRRNQRAYAQAVAHLSEIDQAQAEALQGRFQVTSCPICLESFKDSTTGSDDQPIRLLRCGHVFDESCWNQWVTGGHGNVSKCPICKMDLSTAPTEDGLDTTGDNVATNASLFGSENENDNGNNNDDSTVLRRFQQDRGFRLIQLRRRFPNVVTQSQIQRWSSPYYDSSLVNDRTFREQYQSADQPRSYHNSRQSSSGNSLSFGGGSSSGGRAGRF